MKTFKGKAIYNPSGKAGEYSAWACNFYTGCSNGCDYCYLKKGILAKAMGGDVPVLKRCFKNEEHALEVFVNELHKNKTELQTHGLFFTFTSDPFLPETVELTTKAILTAAINEIPVKVLTKRADFFGVDSIFTKLIREHGIVMRDMKYIAFGFTLTGCDERETGASTNAERIEAMKKLDNAGFKTFASIEPIVVMLDSLHMIRQAADFCDLYKIGLMSGKDVWFETNVVRNQKNVLKIQNAIHEVTGMKFCEYTTKSRKRDGFFARMIFVHHCHANGIDPMKYILRDRTMIYHYLNQYHDEIKFNPYFKRIAKKN